jgi:hypothetical protein
MGHDQLLLLFIIYLFIYLFLLLLLFKVSPKLENWFLSYVTFYPNDICLGTPKKENFNY